jgi:hypothetical protein
MRNFCCSLPRVQFEFVSKAFDGSAEKANKGRLTIGRLKKRIEASASMVLQECNRAGLRAAQKLFDPGANVGFLYPENS